MWLRNLTIFQSDKPFPWSAAELNAMLEKARCPAIGQQTPSVDGFVTPLRDDDLMVHAVNGFLYCQYQETARLLPAGVIKEELDARVDAIEASEGRRPGRKQRADMKDQITFELLPKAFTRSRRIHVLIDTERNRILVDIAAANRADQVISVMRKAVDSLPVKRPEAKVAPTEVLTRWLTDPQQLPAGITLGDRCELKSPREGGGTIKASAMDLGREELLAHLRAGMLAVNLNLCWQDLLEFDLTEELQIKRLRPLDLIREQIDGIDAEDAVAELHARIALQGESLRALIDRLEEPFGEG